MSGKTLIHKLLELRENDSVALVTHDEDFNVDKEYRWRDYVRHVESFARYAVKNIEKNVAIHSFNCPEWFFAALGTVVARKHFCGIYNTNRGEQCIHVLNTGDCDTLVIESQDLLLSNYSTVLDQLVDVNIIIINGSSDDELHKSLYNLSIVYWREEIVDGGESDSDDTHSDDLEVDIDEISEDEIVTMIFTSGTTSAPKAVKISHKNMFAAVDGVLNRIHFRQDSERIVSYLPLSHIAGLALDTICPLWCGAQVHFARPDALRGSLKNTLLTARPTVFLGVPRVWEKFREGMLAVAQKRYAGFTGTVLKGIVDFAKYNTYSYVTSKNSTTKSLMYPMFYLSDRVVSKAKEAIGLDQCRYFVTGAAPISKTTLEYFASLNMPIFEIYGMSETTGVITVSDPIASLKGSCGSAVSGIEVVIGDNDEILVRGDNVFSGYHNYVEETPSVDEEGFLHTGDCGRLVDGNLYITGRIKELIITAGGENIPPVLIEDHIKTAGQFDSHCLLVGDKRKFLSLLVFNPEEEEQIDEERVQSAIDYYNSHHAISNSQKVQKFTLIREGLTVENNLLTPTMKYKRKVIEERFKDEIDSMYN